MEAQTSWVESIKTTFSFERMKEFFTSSRLVEMGSYFGIGIILGYLLKKFGKWVVLTITIFVILGILQQLDLISFGINWRKVQELLGLQVPALDESLLAFYWAWIKANVMAVLVMALGFLLGLRLG